MARPKRVKYRLIEASYESVWHLLDQVIAKYCPDLTDANIALLWQEDMEPDRDGRVPMGKSQIIGDADKELASYDLKVVLNQNAWDAMSEEQRLAYLHHRLCYFVLQKGEDGKPKLDERDRLCFRRKKPDVVEFTSVINAHGTYLCDLEEFVAAANARAQYPLFPPPTDDEGPPDEGEEPLRVPQEATEAENQAESQETVSMAANEPGEAAKGKAKKKRPSRAKPKKGAEAESS